MRAAMQCVLSGGPLGGTEVVFDAPPSGAGASVVGVYAGPVEGARKLAAYELRDTESEDGRVERSAVFVGWQ